MVRLTTVEDLLLVEDAREGSAILGIFLALAGLPFLLGALQLLPSPIRGSGALFTVGVLTGLLGIGLALRALLMFEEVRLEWDLHDREVRLVRRFAFKRSELVWDAREIREVISVPSGPGEWRVDLIPFSGHRVPLSVTPIPDLVTADEIAGTLNRLVASAKEALA
jgi:hypothetical protein